MAASEYRNLQIVEISTLNIIKSLSESVQIYPIQILSDPKSVMQGSHVPYGTKELGLSPPVFQVEKNRLKSS